MPLMSASISLRRRAGGDRNAVGSARRRRSSACWQRADVRAGAGLTVPVVEPARLAGLLGLLHRRQRLLEQAGDAGKSVGGRIDRLLALTDLVEQGAERVGGVGQVLRSEIGARIVGGEFTALPVESASCVVVKSAAVCCSDSRFCRMPEVKVISDMVVTLLVTGRTGLHLQYEPYPRVRVPIGSIGCRSLPQFV